MIKDILYYSFLKIKYFFRLRKSRGFGIHSPFVFNIVTRVIKNKHLYYVFDLLDRDFASFSKREVKYAKIVYRIMNELKVKNVYCKSDVFACDKLICENADSNYHFNNDLIDQSNEYTLIYAGDCDLIDLLKPETIAILKQSKTLLVLDEMYKNDVTLNAYKILKEECNMSIDMFYRALLFFDDKLQNGSYSIKI